MLRMYDVCGILLNGIKSNYVESQVCVRVKGGGGGWRVSGSGSILGKYRGISCRLGCSMYIWMQ